MSQIETSIRKFIVEDIMFKKDESVLATEDSLLEKGIIDSNSMMELIAFLESEFNVSIDRTEILPENFETVASIARIVRTKQKNG